MNRAIRSMAAVLAAAVCLWPLAAAAQDVPTLPDDAYMTTEQVSRAFTSAGFQVDDPITWDWTTPPVSTLHVRDVTSGRELLVLAYPNTAAARTARIVPGLSDREQNPGQAMAGDRGPHLVIGYGESVWLGNLAMVATTQSELTRLYQAFSDRDNCIYVSAEEVHEMSLPHFAVDPDFIQALTNSMVNL